MSANTTSKVKTHITVGDLVAGDEIYYMDGNQVVTRLETTYALDRRVFIEIYVEGVKTPRVQPKSAPIIVMREAN